MDQMSSENLIEALVRLKATEDVVLEIAEKMFDADEGNIFPVDLLAIGAMKRTASNTEGFVTLVNSKNMPAARSLLRIQLDTFIRFYSVWLVDSPQNFAKDVINGNHVRQIKDRNGNKMTDYYLVKELADDYPWLPTVYDKLCGYVHFSEQHLFNSVQKINYEERTLTFSIGKEDKQYSEKSWIETVDCFTHSVHILFYYLNSWIETKNDANTANNAI
ncbi:hypothetical protein [Neptunomonas phycophila]|uniref:hypothetical protein n=1 Tax=Neptunomonas phycophila TaxID=1572645 RepID=UPI0009491B72|nr:hypothetical protein [Neptunomonas phycophila]